MLSVHDQFPQFNLTSVVSLEPGQEFAPVSASTFPGKWLVVFFWPMDFTFVCPTEIAEFGSKNADFIKHEAQVLGVSTDSQFVHLAWRKSNPMLKRIPFPMMADVKRELSTACGVLHPTEGVALRATYIVDPRGIIRWASINDLKVGRNVEEVVRVLRALQSDELTPCNWQPGEPALKVG